jgi:GST-like protein
MVIASRSRSKNPASRIARNQLQAGNQRKPEYLKITAGVILAIVTTAWRASRALAQSRRPAEKAVHSEGSGAALAYAVADGPADVAGGSGALFQLSMVAPEKSAPNVEFFEKRLVNALRAADERLAGREYLADEISVADLALYPVVATRKPVIEKHGGLPNLTRWAERMAARPGIAKGMQVSV